MRPRWKGALPGVLVFSTLVGGCQDAPVGPHAPGTRATPQPAPRITSYSGRQSDSLVAAVLAQWTRAGHPEYQREVDSWRLKNIGTVQPSALSDASDRRATPRAALLTDGTVKDPPKVVTHREALRFGQYSSGSNIPSILEGEMTFVGDQGRIAIGSFGITSKWAPPYAVTGELAFGPGQLVSCSSVTLGTCQNQRRLSGSLYLNGAPSCDASGSGNLVYSAQNVQGTNSYDIVANTPVNSGGAITDDVDLSQQVNAVAPPCDTKLPGDSATYPPNPPPNPVAPYEPPAPWPDPGPEPYEPPPGPPVEEECVAYFSTLLLYVVVICPED